MRALSIRQPWAWLILHGGKDVENRTWRTDYRGWFLIHASKGMTRSEYQNAWRFAKSRGVELPPANELPRGGIVGQAVIVGCVDHCASPWFEGPHGLLVKQATPLPFTPWRGQLGWFDVSTWDRVHWATLATPDAEDCGG